MYREYVLCIPIRLLDCYMGGYCNVTQIPEHIINTLLYCYNKKKAKQTGVKRSCTTMVEPFSNGK